MQKLYGNLLLCELIRKYNDSDDKYITHTQKSLSDMTQRGWMITLLPEAVIIAWKCQVGVPPYELLTSEAPKPRKQHSLLPMFFVAHQN